MDVLAWWGAEPMTGAGRPDATGMAPAPAPACAWGRGWARPRIAAAAGMSCCSGSMPSACSTMPAKGAGASSGAAAAAGVAAVCSSSSSAVHAYAAGSLTVLAVGVSPVMGTACAGHGVVHARGGRWQLRGRGAWLAIYGTATSQDGRAGGRSLGSNAGWSPDGLRAARAAAGSSPVCAAAQPPGAGLR